MPPSDPSPSSSYASLPRPSDPRAAAVDGGYLTSEAEKLESLKGALFAAFQEAPKAGIPTALVDLVATYTSALRLQMNLIGYQGMRKRQVKVSTTRTSQP